MRTQIACTRRLFKHEALILPESALRRCYYPLFPDDTTAAEMLDLVTEKRSIVLQRNLGREATIFQMSNRAWRSIARYTNHKWIFLYGGRLPSDNPGSYESRKSSWLRDDSFSIIACATFKSGESFNAVPSRYRSVNQIKFIPSLSLSLNFIDRGRSKFGWVEKCFFFSFLVENSRNKIMDELFSKKKKNCLSPLVGGKIKRGKISFWIKWILYVPRGI